MNQNQNKQTLSGRTFKDTVLNRFKNTDSGYGELTEREKILLSIADDENNGMRNAFNDLVAALQHIISVQYDPSKTLANLNGAISNAKELLSKANNIQSQD
jgi:methyl-accepting chemotaxis protein